MEVREGFKWTEAGSVPNDWDVFTSGDLIEFQGGSQPDKSSFVSSEKPGYVRLIQIRDYKTDKYMTFVPANLARRFCEEDDIMIGRYGPPIFQILIGIKGAYNVALIKAIPNKNLDKTYAYYFLKQEKLFSFVEKLSQRSSGQTGVDLKELREYPFPLPPTKAEQTAIAAALSDADALISILEKLIVKKRHIKQGAMQELLKPKEGWVVKKLGEVFSFSGGYSASREQLSNDGFCYLHYGDIHGAKKTFINVKNEYTEIPKLKISLKNISPKSLLNEGDIVFVDASEDDEGTSRHIVVKNPDGVPYISGLHTIVAKSIDDSVNNDYKRYCFQSAYIKSQFKFYAVGTKVSGISKTNIAKIEIAFPTPDEQTRIATILSDMDAEIEALEKKLEKYRQIKQGMMQELLTGKTRLIESTPPSP